AKKAGWITDALTAQIPANFPAIKAILWFNWNSNAGSTYVIESSSAAKSAFAAGIASSVFAANDFGSLPAGSKVAPLNPSLPTATSPATRTATTAAVTSSTSTRTAAATATAMPTKTNTPKPAATSQPQPSPTPTKRHGKPGK